MGPDHPGRLELKPFRVGHRKTPYALCGAMSSGRGHDSVLQVWAVSLTSCQQRHVSRAG